VIEVIDLQFAYRGAKAAAVQCVVSPCSAVKLSDCSDPAALAA